MSGSGSSNTGSTATPQAGWLRLPSWRTLGIAAVLTAILLFLALRHGPVPRHFRRQAVAETTMPDGMILTLTAVTYGTRHSLPMPRKPWPDWLSSQLPPSLDRDTADPSIVLWFTRWDPATRKPLDFDWWLKCTVEDAAGWQIEDREPETWHHQVSFGSSHSSNHSSGARPYDAEPGEHDCIVASSVLRMFRCHGETFRLKVHNTTGEIVAEFDVPWPGPGSFPQWRPEPLPISKPAGDLTVTLKCVSTWDGGLVNERDWEISIDPEFEITRDGRASDWQVDTYWLSDALGNNAAAWNCDLSPREAAWKITARLFRKPDAAPVPAEAWHIGQIAIPPAEASDTLQRTGTANGVRVELLAIGGPGPVVYRWTGPGSGETSSIGSGASFPISDDIRENVLYHVTTERKGGSYVRTVECDAPHVFLKVPPLDVSQKLQLHIVDADGNILPGAMHRLKESANEVFWFFDPIAVTESVDVSVAITDAREVEFLVAPPEVKR